MATAEPLSLSVWMSASGQDRTSTVQSFTNYGVRPPMLLNLRRCPGDAVLHQAGTIPFDEQHRCV